MGLNFTYTLENIGNIDKASILIKPLTIIAGENSSGKTFVTKTLYSMLNSIYKQHFVNKLLDAHRNLFMRKNIFDSVCKNPANIDQEFNAKFDNYMHEMFKIIVDVRDISFNEEEEVVEKNKKIFLDFQEETKKYFEVRLKLQKFQNYSNYIKSIEIGIAELVGTLFNRRTEIIRSVDNELKDSFKKNFQITKLKQVIKNGGKSAKLSIDKIGEVEIDSKDIINFNFDSNGIEQVQNVGNIVFFDSPVYAKIRKALERKESRSLSIYNEQKEDKYLKGYPEYIEELYQFIDKEYIDTPDFDAISHEIQERISGRLDVSKSGDINYIDNNKNTIPLSLTAMGISNVGLIDLLLRNNIINKGSFLIMDEPEVHLHPQWQVFLAQILYKIAKNGANIIIATHSLDFLKAFENILKNENAQKVIAINKMPYDKTFNELSELEKVGIVLDDLSKPFYDLYMQDI